MKHKSKTIIKNIITAEGLSLYNSMRKKMDKYIEETNPQLNIEINDVIRLLQNIRKNCTEKFDIKFE